MNFASSRPTRVPKAAAPAAERPAGLACSADIEAYLEATFANNAYHAGALARDRARRRHDWIRALDAFVERLARESGP
jgi:hypothetical protein